jgi:hypothetical protein
MKIKINLLKFIPYAIFIFYVLILAFGSKIGFPESMSTSSRMPYLADKPIGEDAYYMLTVARNFALGNGLTYNFNLKTTGIQPLATFLYSSIFIFSNLLGLSDWSALSLIIITNALLLILFTITLIKQASFFENDFDNLSWIIPLLTLFNFGLFRTFTYGLETRLYLLLFAITVNFTIKLNLKEISPSQLLKLSFLIGFTALARIDFIIVVLFFFLIQYIQKNISIKNLFIIGFLSTLFTLPWFIYVYSVTGSFIPSSGSAQSELATIHNVAPRFLAMLIAINENLTPWLYTGARNIFVLTGFLSLLLFIFFFRKSLLNTINHIKSHRATKVYNSWLLSLLTLILIYIIFFWASHFYYRYSSPLSVFIIAFFGIIISKFFKDKVRTLKYIFSSIIIILFFLQAYYSLHTGTIGNTHSVSAGFIKQHFSNTKKVGAFQSGVIGYFNNNVINLDGKIEKIL